METPNAASVSNREQAATFRGGFILRGPQTSMTASVFVL